MRCRKPTTEAAKNAEQRRRSCAHGSAHTSWGPPQTQQLRRPRMLASVRLQSFRGKSVKCSVMSFSDNSRRSTLDTSGPGL